MVILLKAAVAMALRDAFATLLVVCEAKGRPLLAGAFDAAGDLATILVTLFGAGEVIRTGWTAHAILVVGVMVATSFVGTWFWTKVGGRIAGRGDDRPCCHCCAK